MFAEAQFSPSDNTPTFEKNTLASLGSLGRLSVPVWFNPRMNDASHFSELGFWNHEKVNGSVVRARLRLMEEFLQSGDPKLLLELRGDLGEHAIAAGANESHRYSSRLGAQLALSLGIEKGCADSSPPKIRRQLEQAIFQLSGSSNMELLAALREVLLRAISHKPELVMSELFVGIDLLTKQSPLLRELGFGAIRDYAAANLAQTTFPFEPHIQGAHANVNRRQHLDAERSAVQEAVRGAERALVIHDINEAMGDEWIRNSYLVTALLSGSPTREITILSKRPYLYNHPRITVIDPTKDEEALHALAQSHFDIVFDQSSVTDPLTPALKRFSHTVAERAPLCLRTPGGSNYFSTAYHYAFLSEWGKIHLDDHIQSLSNPYDYSQRLITWLGLPNPWPLDVGRCLLFGRLNSEVGVWWQNVVLPRLRSHAQAVTFFSPFGGSYAEKGFLESEDARLVGVLRRLIARGDLVILAPNGTPWGSHERVERIAAMLTDEEKRQVITSVPTPAEHKTFQIQLMGVADRYVGVEGGGSHLALALCKQCAVLLFSSSGFQQWLPLLRCREQSDFWAEGPWRERQ